MESREGGHLTLVNLHKVRVELFVRHPDSQVEGPAHQVVLLCLPLASLPPLLVSTGEKVAPDLGLGENWVSTHSVDKTLELVHPVLYELLLVATCKERMSASNSGEAHSASGLSRIVIRPEALNHQLKLWFTFKLPFPTLGKYTISSYTYIYE